MDLGQAENSSLQTLALDPDNARYLANYARFLATVRRDPSRADALFRRSVALELDQFTAWQHA